MNQPQDTALGFDEPVLTIDPRRQFGSVCVIGTRIPASSVAWDAWHVGIDRARDDYPCTEEQALVCCWWEVSSAQSVVPSRRTKDERAMVERWGEWADTALLYLGGHRNEPCPHPPAEEIQPT